MRVKHGVNVDDLDPIVQDALPVIEAIRLEALEQCLKDSMTVTSGAEGYPGDGVHMVKSWHYPQNCPRRKGLAIDVRADFAATFVTALRKVLGPGWDVVPEGTHIHIERDPNKRPLEPEKSVPA